jgi:hypothetical protein
MLLYCIQEWRPKLRLWRRQKKVKSSIHSHVEK